MDLGLEGVWGFGLGGGRQGGGMEGIFFPFLFCLFACLVCHLCAVHQISVEFTFS